MAHVFRNAAVSLAAVGMIGTVGIFAAGCQKPTQAAMAGGRPPANVNVEKAVERDVPVYIDEIGKTTASETVTIMPQVAGKLESLHFVDGAELPKGKLLFTIDPRPFKYAVAQAEGQLAKDKAAAENAERFLKRQSDIFGKGIVAPSDYDTAVFNAQAARAAVQADQAAVDSANLNLKYCSIESPIAGRASVRMVDPGNIVKINETPMLMIQRMDPIYADFTINESELARVRAHMADHTLRTLVSLPGETTEGRSGDLTFLDNAVQDASGTIKLRATLANADRRFWPGQFVNVRLVLQVKKNAVLVLASAIQLGQKGPYVYVVKNDTAELHPVVLGQRQEAWQVMESGVAGGDVVITNGQLTVMPGGKVKIDPPSTTQPSAPESESELSGPTTAPTTQPTTQSSKAEPATRPIVSAPKSTIGGQS